MSKESKEIRKKGILLVASILLLLAAGLAMAFAWYTKTTSVSQMSFDTAKWEYSANFSNEPIILNIYNLPVTYGDESEGVSIVDGKVAPGAEGYAPVRLSAGSSDVAISYSLSVDKSLMSDEFKERIYFFQDAERTIEAGNNWGDANGNGRTVMTGVLEPGETKTVILYWRWVYEASEIPYTVGGKRYTRATDAEFDAFDTKVGMNPDRYEADMIAQVLISGTQIKPGETISDTPETFTEGGSESGGEPGIDEPGIPDYPVPVPVDGATDFWYDASERVYGCTVGGTEYYIFDGEEWEYIDDFENAFGNLESNGHQLISFPIHTEDFWYDNSTGKYCYMIHEDGYYVFEYNESTDSWTCVRYTEERNYR